MSFVTVLSEIPNLKEKNRFYFFISFKTKEFETRKEGGGITWSNKRKCRGLYNWSIALQLSSNLFFFFFKLNFAHVEFLSAFSRLCDVLVLTPQQKLKKVMETVQLSNESIKIKPHSRYTLYVRVYIYRIDTHTQYCIYSILFSQIIW